MSSTSKFEKSNDSGLQATFQDEKGRTEFVKKNSQRQNSKKMNSKSQNNKEPKEGQNQHGNNAKAGNKIKVLQNNSNNSKRRKQSKKNDNKKDTLQKEKETPQPSKQIPNEIANKSESNRFVQELRKLEEDGVYPLKKKSVRFPRAKFFCRLCDYHCDTLEISIKHIHESRHTNLRETKVLERTLNALLPPVQTQYDALTELIEKNSLEVGSTEEELDQRLEIQNELEKEMKEIVEETSLEMTGSTLSKFALKSSDLNLDVLAPENSKVAAGILAVKKIIEMKTDKYTDSVNDLSSSYPCLSFTHKKHGVRIVVGVSSSTSRSLNRMLSYYSILDRRVKTLVTAFKYWAKLCKIDKQQEGSLSSHCFPLMVIHFLQQISPPVVPVLHELFESKAPDFNLTSEELQSWNSTNKQSTGELWLTLFKFYALDFKTSVNVINIRHSKPFAREESKWGKKMAIEDPFHTKRNQTHTVSSYLVFDYITSRIKNTYRYFVIPQMSFGPLFRQLEHEYGPLFKANNADNYTSESDIEKNLAKTKPSSENEDEDEEEDFPEDEEENIDEGLGTKDDPSILMSQLSISSGEKPKADACGSDALPTPLIIEQGTSTTNDAETLPVENSVDEKLPFMDIKELKATLGRISKGIAAALMKQVKKDMLNYSFNQVNFTGGKSVPLYCCVCQKSGHAKKTCTEHELPPLKPLPYLRKSYLETLSHMFFQLKNECSPKPEEIRHRDYIVSELQKCIKEFLPQAVLKLFGSSANGFGFGNSDLDICLTFNDRPTGEGIDHISVIEEIAKKLKRFRECRHVLAITTAKVPIVKFSLNRAQLEADLSLYNTLALQNTKLLSNYTAIDHRVKILGYTMKYFAKLCDIGDASRGSLSSYAYILMILHFLQQCRPAVIPVLQELYDHSKEPPEHIIDGWNAWFFDDLFALDKVWKDYGKNKQSVGDLWVDLLRYYTEVFNWKENVITIRQLEPLSKLEKLWTTKCIAIEDPFDLSHNLGAGLSRKMNAYILTAFIKGREVFGSGIERPPYGYPSLGAFLFDKRLLTDGAPPNDRGCRWCGRIGHIVKECPRKQQKKDNKDTKATNSRKTNEKGEMRSKSSEQKATPIPVPAPPPVPAPKNAATTSTAVQNSIGKKNHNHKPAEIPKGTPLVVKGMCFPFEILDSFLNCSVCNNMLLNLGFKIVPIKLFNALFRSVTGLISIDFSVRSGEDHIMVVYDKYKCLSPKQNKAYLKDLNNVYEKIRIFLRNFSFKKDIALRKLEIYRFYQQVENSLDDMIVTDSSIKKIVTKEKKKRYMKVKVNNGKDKSVTPSTMNKKQAKSNPNVQSVKKSLQNVKKKSKGVGAMAVPISPARPQHHFPSPPQPFQLHQQLLATNIALPKQKLSQNQNLKSNTHHEGLKTNLAAPANKAKRRRKPKVAETIPNNTYINK